MNQLYYNKYLKYKNKYLNLKQLPNDYIQEGGSYQPTFFLYSVYDRHKDFLNDIKSLLIKKGWKESTVFPVDFMFLYFSYKIEPPILDTNQSKLVNLIKGSTFDNLTNNQLFIENYKYEYFVYPYKLIDVNNIVNINKRLALYPMFNSKNIDVNIRKIVFSKENIQEYIKLHPKFNKWMLRDVLDEPALKNGHIFDLFCIFIVKFNPFKVYIIKKKQYVKSNVMFDSEAINKESNNWHQSLIAVKNEFNKEETPLFFPDDCPDGWTKEETNEINKIIENSIKILFSHKIDINPDNNSKNAYFIFNAFIKLHERLPPIIMYILNTFSPHLHKHIVPALVSILIDNKDHPDFKKLEVRQLIDKNDYFISAYDKDSEEEELSGSLRIRFKDNSYIIRDVFVLENKRNLGIGKKLMIETINFLKKKKKPIVLYVDPENAVAISLYKKLGFKLIFKSDLFGDKYQYFEEASNNSIKRQVGISTNENIKIVIGDYNSYSISKIFNKKVHTYKENYEYDRTYSFGRIQPIVQIHKTFFVKTNNDNFDQAFTNQLIEKGYKESKKFPVDFIFVAGKSIFYKNRFNTKDSNWINLIYGNFKIDITNKYILHSRYEESNFIIKLDYITQDVIPNLDINNLKILKPIKPLDDNNRKGIRIIQSKEDIKSWLSKNKEYREWFLQDYIMDPDLKNGYKFYFKILILVKVEKDKLIQIYTFNDYYYVIAKEKYENGDWENNNKHDTYTQYFKSDKIVTFPNELPDKWTKKDANKAIENINEIIKKITITQGELYPEWNSVNGFEIFSANIMFSDKIPYLLEINAKIEYKDLNPIIPGIIETILEDKESEFMTKLI
jgi:ribosomal protein S18 acetylase RimI-like enzyme